MAQHVGYYIEKSVCYVEKSVGYVEKNVWVMLEKCGLCYYLTHTFRPMKSISGDVVWYKRPINPLLHICLRIQI